MQILQKERTSAERLFLPETRPSSNGRRQWQTLPAEQPRQQRRRPTSCCPSCPSRRIRRRLYRVSRKPQSLPSFKLVSSSESAPTQSCSTAQINNAITFLYNKLFVDAVSEIKSNLKPTFNRPYLWVNVQNSLKIRGLYDTGADISCISEKIFRQIPPQNRPTKLAIDKSPNFRSAGGQPLPVRGLYKFAFTLNGKQIEHPCYVIPDLNEPLILGIDFIQHHQLWYCPKNKSFAWESQPNWGQGHLKICAATVVPPLSVAYIKASIRTESGSLPAENNLCIANITSSLHPLLTGGPYLVEPDSLGQVTVAVKNCAPTELELSRNDFIGKVENVENCEKREINPAYLHAIAEQRDNARPRQTLTAQKRKFIEENVKMHVPEQFQAKYRNLLFKHHEAISQNKFDLGRTDTLMHEIALKTQEPIYVKQFKIPDAHRQEVEKHVLEWLKLGVIQPARSRYNSPIFAVLKKDGNVRLVQDFRALNNASFTDKYSMKDVSECIGEIGRSGSTIFFHH